MADATYDRNAAFEMLSKKHGSYATPEMINEELDNFERENNLGTPKAQPQQEAVVAPLTGQDKAIADQASVYSLSPTTARETVNAMTAPPVGSTSLPDVASAAWNNLSTPEKYAVGTGVAALGSMATYGAKKLVDRFLIPDKQVAPIDRTRDIPLGDHTPPPPPPPPSGPKLSPIDEQILSRQNINRQVREEYLNRTRGGEPTVVPTTVAPAQTAVSVNPKVPALLQPPANAVVPPAVSEPVAAPVLPTTPLKTEAAPVQAEPAPVAEAPVTTAPITQPPVEAAAPEKSVPPPKTKAPKAEYFEGYKNLPGTERQLLGTLGVANNTERAKALVNALKSTLPEGAALEFPKTEAGVSKGGMPNPQDVMAFTNKHLGTDMKLDEKGKFPADFRFTEENLAKMHQSILDEYANAKTPAAKAAAEKGFATLRSLAGLAGFGALAYGSLEAYKHGKKTGDWTPAGELGLNTVAGAINPALMLGTHMTGLNAGEEQELAKRRYQAMVGGGRGIAPPSAYKR